MERRKEMFYLTTHTTNILFTVIWRQRHMVNDHTDSERGNPLLPHRIAHTTAFVTPVVDGKKEGNVLFNNPLNKHILFMGLYAVGHMVKDHSD